MKVLVFIAGLAPLVRLAWRGTHGSLGANPVQTVQFETGLWALRLLFATLGVTPLVRLTGRSELIRVRRMIGLFAFLYATLHFSTYLVLDMFFDWKAIWKDVAKHLWITAGFSAFVLMIPLAVTSTDAMIRRLGKRWGQLHRLIYPAAILGVIHFLWLVKKDKTEPLIYAAILAILLGYRIASRLLSQRA
ncbi:MAG: sulfoxide reductase heme-binding subunit YedZ [Elusimicrobia bacterium]|nr:sulfoxide reductase heme-binding subunit YedZ [Elusimicrobiota bacterium]